MFEFKKGFLLPDPKPTNNQGPAIKHDNFLVIPKQQTLPDFEIALLKQAIRKNDVKDLHRLIVDLNRVRFLTVGLTKDSGLPTECEEFQNFSLLHYACFNFPETSLETITYLFEKSPNLHILATSKLDGTEMEPLDFLNPEQKQHVLIEMGLKEVPVSRCRQVLFSALALGFIVGGFMAATQPETKPYRPRRPR